MKRKQESIAGGFMVMIAALAILSMLAVVMTQAETYSDPKVRIIKSSYHE
jgi:hypothetical protein